ITQGGVIPRLIGANLAPTEIIEELYLRCFGRAPSQEEMLKLEPHMGVTETQKDVYHDVFWALMNGKEFMFNH
ncbi:MAG: cell surface protein, partial [Verrucomicrobiota bacterium]|nr:cell surface protein [Verrucomicrobiota bacterium]